MKRILVIVGLTIMCSPPIFGGDSSPSFLIQPGVSVGPITSITSEAQLHQIYGDANVKPKAIDVGEGEWEQGTVIYPDEPSKTIEVLWKDETHRIPAEIYIRNRSLSWKTADGIAIGTSLQEIEKLNGGPVHMAGFDFDYSGTVVDCANGALTYLGVDKGKQGIRGRSLLIRLEPGSDIREKVSDKEYNSVVGDRIILSTSTVMQKINPTVYEIIVSFQ